MKLSLLLLMLAAMLASAQQDGEEAAEAAGLEEEQPAQEKAVLAPESQEIVLAEASPECYDSIYAVINGEAEQKSLTEECNKELVAGFAKTPMGQLQRKESYVLQIASLVRVSPRCRREFEAAAPKPTDAEHGEGSDEAQAEVSQACQDEFQNQYRAMQQWVGSTTVSRMSQTCKAAAATGKLDRECEQEFLSVKPGVIETLETQNNQKLKEPLPAKEDAAAKEKKKSTTTARKEKKAKPWIDSSLLFLVFWSLAIGGSMVYACFVYHKDDTYRAKIADEVEILEEKDERETKKQAKLEKKAKRGMPGQGARH